MENRKKILQDLYTLRAGLSFISQNKDDIALIKKNSMNLDSKIRDNKDHINLYSNRVQSQQTNVKYCKSQIEYKEAQKDDSLEEELKYIDNYITILESLNLRKREFRKEYIEINNKSEYSSMEDLIRLEMFRDSGDKKRYKDLKKSINKRMQTKEKYLTYVAFNCGECIRYITKILYKPKYRNKLDDSISFKRIDKEDKRKEKLRRKINRSLLKCNKKAINFYIRALLEYKQYLLDNDNYIRESIERYYKKLEAEESELIKYQSTLDEYIAYTKKLETSLKNNTNDIELKIDISKNTFQLLFADYNEFLPLSHWKNLDMLIYFIQEKYADSIKEAINLILQQQQNDRVVNAINNMESNIIKTINTGLQNIESKMVLGFSLLSNQLTQLHSQQQFNHAQLIKLNDSIDLGNALKNKASTTSLQLTEDLNYMRTLASQQEVRRRNGQ